MSFRKIVDQMGSFGEKRKKMFFRFCRPILYIFGFPLLIPMRDLCGCCLSFIISLKDDTLNGIGSITSYCSTEDPVGTSRLESRNQEISRNQD